METTTSALSERILYLCACVAWAAKGDLEHLETAVPQALDHGVTINELKDAFAQLYAYAGFPRSLNALGAMDGVTPQFEGHKECAVFMGNTPEQVAELCRWLSHVTTFLRYTQEGTRK